MAQPPFTPPPSPVPPTAPLRGGQVALLYLAIGFGSLLGGTLRWLVAELAHGGLGLAVVWATLFANVTGSFLIGLYAALAGAHGRLKPGPIQRQMIVSGFCGGYTTFSIFSLDIIRLLESGAHGLAGLHVSLSLAGWLGAVFLGFMLGQRLNRRR